MGVNAIDLTTVAAVNNLLSQASGTDSTLIQTEITNLSRYILTKTSRSFLSGIRSYSERYNGNGSNDSGSKGNGRSAGQTPVHSLLMIEPWPDVQ